MNRLETSVKTSDEMCMKMWGISCEEVSNLRLVGVYEAELRYINKHGYDIDNSRRLYQGILPQHVSKKLCDLGVLRRRKIYTQEPIVNIELLEECLAHPAIARCFDPG